MQIPKSKYNKYIVRPAGDIIKILVANKYYKKNDIWRAPDGSGKLHFMDYMFDNCGQEPSCNYFYEEE